MINNIIIRTCERDDHLAVLCYQSWRRIYDGLITFAHDGEYETATKQLDAEHIHIEKEFEVTTEV